MYLVIYRFDNVLITMSFKNLTISGYLTLWHFDLLICIVKALKCTYVSLKIFCMIIFEVICVESYQCQYNFKFTLSIKMGCLTCGSIYMR